jgi:hypothetical protein
MKKFIAFYLLFVSLYLIFPPSAYAVCPVCTVAIGAGLGISRALGIDDAVTSVWIGGLILSSSYWFYDWLTKKKPALNTTNYLLLTIFLMYLIVLIPLWYGKYIGRYGNQLFGIDKIIIGTVAGSLVFLFAKWADQKVRQIKGKQLFNYQRVVFPVSGLVIMCLILGLVVSKI